MFLHLFALAFVPFRMLTFVALFADTFLLVLIPFAALGMFAFVALFAGTFVLVLICFVALGVFAFMLFFRVSFVFFTSFSTLAFMPLPMLLRRRRTGAWIGVLFLLRYG